MKAKRKRSKLSYGQKLERIMRPLEVNSKFDDAEDYTLREGWVALTRMEKNPNEEDFRTLIQICNEVVCLLNMGWGNPNDNVTKAQEGLLRIVDRANKYKSFAMDAELMRLLPDVLFTWEKQYKTAPIKAINGVKLYLKELENA